MSVKKILFLLVAVLMAATGRCLAEVSFQTINGIRYQINPDTKMAMVVPLRGEKYTGDVVIPAMVKGSDGVEYPVTALGDHAFEYCEELTSITLPLSVTTLGAWCFEDCLGLTSVTLPASVTTLGERCFEDCENLTSINIPSSVSVLPEGCFAFCDKLASLTLPSSVTKIGSGCFDRCLSLKSLTFVGECPDGLADSQLASACALYVPKVYLQVYKDALGSAFPNINAAQEEGDGSLSEPCATPTIAYVDGKLRFDCSTPKAEYHSTITDADVMPTVKDVKDGELELSACYNISVYATADGYKPSEKATAMLYWVKATGNLEDTTDGIKQVVTRGIVATSQDGIVTISGLDNGEEVRFYSADGKQIGAVKAIDGVASQAVPSASLVIAKIGGQAIKIAVK